MIIFIVNINIIHVVKHIVQVQGCFEDQIPISINDLFSFINLAFTTHSVFLTAGCAPYRSHLHLSFTYGFGN